MKGIFCAGFVALVVASGCGGGEPGGNGGGGGQGTTMTTTTADTPHLQLDADYTIQPGDEKYVCYTMKVPADKEIVFTRLVPTYGEGTHHILFSQTIAPEPDGMSECDVLIKDTWLPLYAGGKQSGPLDVPADSGIKLITKGQQILMQLHLQNTTSAPLNARTSMRMEYAEASAVSKLAGIFGLDNHVISIPPHTTSATELMHCNPNKDMDVFAVLGHMHKHGKHLTLSRGQNAGDEVLYDETWSFDQQPITAKTMKIAPTDQIFLECEHGNDTDQPITYGESSDTEMCAAVFYYTPFDQLDGCTNTGP